MITQKLVDDIFLTGASKMESMNNFFFLIKQVVYAENVLRVINQVSIRTVIIQVID